MGSSGVGSGNLHSVFVYGSLLADDVVRVLLKRVPESSSAVLNNYHRFSIKGRVYPAILPLLNKKVTGKVLLGITDPELHILDVFEDVEYQRTAVDVSFMVCFFFLSAFMSIASFCTFSQLVNFMYIFVAMLLMQDNADKLQAQAYVWADKNDPNLYGDWDFQEWQGVHMKDFIKMTTSFIEELELPESKARVATYESFYQKNADNTTPTS
ncbi:hypothetical protein Ddye_007672 [Dipteronia dyeriana]|uniref:Putative gamma-glutamylcyclotransferase n=1 Tax=Dipteronia dyeriana TaxID=168575 RepID=A0AAD9XKD5_9ROSI|nr:hypothetical protein Ddye_007672 [Dipteronia dyeriana]